MDFNLSKSVMDLMFLGRLFHNFGVNFENLYHQMSFKSISERRFLFYTVNEDCD